MPWLILNPVAIVVYIIATLIAIIHHTGIDNTPFIVGHLLFALAITRKYVLHDNCNSTMFKFRRFLKSNYFSVFLDIFLTQYYLSIKWI